MGEIGPVDPGVGGGTAAMGGGSTAGGGSSATGGGSSAAGGGSAASGGGSAASGGGSAASGGGGTLADPYQPDDGPVPPGTRTVNVSTASQLRAAIAAALPGDDIILADGTYAMTADVTVNRGGTSTSPIFVRACSGLRARITFCGGTVEGFRVSAPHWTFVGLTIEGACPDAADSENEHAFHITGRADRTVLRDNHIINFKSAVKLNAGESPYVWPDQATFVGNTFRYTRALGGLVPHNQLNLDGGDRHVIRRNRFVDLVAPASVARSASAIYLKMTCRDFVVEQNLVVCRKHVTTDNTRRGIQSGDVGVGASSPYCDGDCANLRGLYRNNIIIACQGNGNSGGIHIGNEQDTVYTHHTVHDVKNNFLYDKPGATVSVFSSLISKDFTYQAALRLVADVDNLRQDATAPSGFWTNPGGAELSLTATGTAAIRQKVDRRADTPHDFCGNLRGARTDLGAIDHGHPQGAACVARVKAWYDAL